MEGVGEISEVKTWEDYIRHKDKVLEYNLMDCKATMELVERFYIDTYDMYVKMCVKRSVPVGWTFEQMYRSVWTCAKTALFFYKEIFVTE